MRRCFRWLGLLVLGQAIYYLGYLHGRSALTPAVQDSAGSQVPVASRWVGVPSYPVPGAAASSAGQPPESDVEQQGQQQQQSAAVSAAACLSAREQQLQRQQHQDELQAPLASVAEPSATEGVAASGAPADGAALAGHAGGLFRDGYDFGGMGGNKGGKCAEFEGVDFPLDSGWRNEVRALVGASIYGTGWAQRRLREHQFPKSGCNGREVVEHGMFRSGIGSNIHISAAVLTHALNSNRLYVWPEVDEHNPWTVGNTKNTTADCPSGKKLRSYECYFKPVSSCKPTGKGPKYIGVQIARGGEKLRGIDTVPNMMNSLLKCSGYPMNYWPKWWRAQVAAFILRPSDDTRRELDEFRQAALVGDMGASTVGMYVRHGDKYYEAPEYPFKDYAGTAEWLVNKGNKRQDTPAMGEKCYAKAEKLLRPFVGFVPRLRDKRQLYIGSDDPEVIAEATWLRDWSLVYMNVTRLKKRMPNMKVVTKLGPKQMVMESLLNMELLLESDAFICTWSSNWCRLVDEMRMTVGMKANHASFEILKSCPSFNWVHGQGKDTADFR